MRTSQVRAQQSPGRALRSLDLRGAGPGRGAGVRAFAAGPTDWLETPLPCTARPLSARQPRPALPRPAGGLGDFQGRLHLSILSRFSSLTFELRASEGVFLDPQVPDYGGFILGFPKRFSQL